MRATMTNKILLLLFALALAVGLVHAQVYPNAPQRATITGFKTNLIRSDTLSFAPVDTTKALTVVASYKEGGVAVPALAPIIVRRGLKFVVQWNVTPPFTDGYYKVLSGGQSIFEGPVHITTQGISLPPGTSGTVLSGIYSQLGVLQGLYNTLNTGKVSTATYNAYVISTAQSLATMASDIAGRVLTSDYNTYKSNTAISLSNINAAIALRLAIADTAGFQRRATGFGLYPNVDKTKLAGIASGATNVTDNAQLPNGAGYLNSSTGVPIGTYTTNRGNDLANIAGKLTQTQADALYKGIGYAPTASDVGAVSTGTYATDKSANDAKNTTQDGLIAGNTTAIASANTNTILGWVYSQSFRLVSASRDANGAITTANIVWPDGNTGTFTTITASTAFPGAIDSYRVTYVKSGITTTYTQPAVTRDASGSVTAQPSIVIS